MSGQGWIDSVGNEVQEISGFFRDPGKKFHKMFLGRENSGVNSCGYDMFPLNLCFLAMIQ